MHDLYITFRSVFIWILSVFLIFFLSSLAVLTYPFRMYNFVHLLSRFFARTMLFISGVHYEIRDPENILPGGPVIVVSNHQSMFDAIGMYTFLQMPFRWVAKSSLFRIPVFGLALKAAGYIPVERDNPKQAAKSLFEAARDVQKGISVVIFPEGTRSFEDGTMRPFKNGSFLLAKKAKVMLQPVVFWGSHKIIPVDRNNFMQKIYPGKIAITILPPISPDSYRNLSIDEISDFIRKDMEKSLLQMKSADLQEPQ